MPDKLGAIEAKTCRHCGRAFTKPPGMKPYYWDARVFCSPACTREADKHTMHNHFRKAQGYKARRASEVQDV
jgi:hypothetical protein